jgi:CheY-like chemotaxis protein
VDSSTSTTKPRHEPNPHFETLHGDGLEAFAKLDAAPFDAVVLDVRMPGLDGMGAFRIVASLRGLRAHQREAEAGSAAFGVLDVDAASVAFGDLPDDREAESRSRPAAHDV